MKDIQKTLSNELKLSFKHSLIVSVSGGVDSMVLLSLLLETKYKIVVVHFNHQKREQSAIEKGLVENFCIEHKIPFHYYTIEVQEGNFHHQAHIMRKHYLKEVAHLHKTPYILTAHHLDDLFENVLIKMTRGSNLLGYAGMQMMHTKDGYTYIKPLLYTPKQEIIEYAIKHSIPYLDDESNEENYYLRNRYRHAVIPLMKQENEQMLEQIIQYNQQLSKAFHFIREQTMNLVPNQNEMDIELFLQQEDVIKEDIIAYILEQHDIPFTYDMVQKIKKLIESKRPNQSYRLNKKLELIKSYKKVYIKPFSHIKPYKIKVQEGPNKLQNMAIFTFFHKSVDNPAELIKLCYNELAFPLWLRHREDGDVLSYNYGHKKLKKLLIDKKIPMEERESLWVLTDNNHQVLWVENHYLNQELGNKNTLYFQLKKGDKKHAS